MMYLTVQDEGFMCVLPNLNITMTLDMIYVIQYNAIHVLGEKKHNGKPQLDKSFLYFFFLYLNIDYKFLNNKDNLRAAANNQQLLLRNNDQS